MCDSQGFPLAVAVSPGQTHESTNFEEVLNITRIRQPQGRPRTRPAALAGDKAYSSKAIKDWLKQHKIEPVIPSKANQERDPNFDKEAYVKRNIVERCIGWLKEARRIATRYEKLAVSFLAMIKLEIIRRILLLDLPDRA